jgi:predicted transcriptional regulator
MNYEEFKKILKENNLTLKEFSILSNTSYNTCLKWGREDRPVSNWVKPFLDLYVKNNQLQKEVDRHIAFKQEFYEMMNGQTITVR